MNSGLDFKLHSYPLPFPINLSNMMPSGRGRCHAAMGRSGSKDVRIGYMNFQEIAFYELG
jgi:hypothetical protein